MSTAVTHFSMNNLYYFISMLFSTPSFSALFSALFCFVFRFLLHPVFYFSVQSLSESYRSKGFYVMEQNNRQKCILAIRMSSVSGPEMVGQRWMVRGIQLSCVQAQHSLSPPSLLLCQSSPPSSSFCLSCSLTHFLFWLHDRSVGLGTCCDLLST